MASYLTAENENEDEGEGCVEFAQYGQLTREHLNPLVHNKGTSPGVKELHSKQSEILTAYLRQNPAPVAVPLDILKQDSLASDAAMSNTSELNTNERSEKVNNVFRLPLFEVSGGTIQARVEEKGPEEEVAAGPDKQVLQSHEHAPYKSRSMKPRDKLSFESFGEELTPEQYRYFKAMYAFKTDYLIHALNMREIYFQYVMVSREDMSFTFSAPFTTRIGRLMQQAEKFVRDPALPKGTPSS